MTAPRPRALVHQGRHLAAGLLLPAPLLGEAEARRRVVEGWRPGDEVRAVEGGLLHRFGRPRPLDAGEAPGLLLVEEAGLLLGLPLSRAEREALAPFPGALVVARAGEAVALRPGAPLDPAAWLGLAPAIVKVEPLGGPAAVPPPALAPVPPEDLRETLSVPPAAAEAGAVATALRAALDRVRERSPSAPPPTRAPASPSADPGAGVPAGLVIFGVLALGRLLASMGSDPDLQPLGVLAALLILGLLIAFVVSLLAQGRSTGTAPGPGGPAARAAAPAAPPAVSWLGRAWDRLLVATRVARLAGLRQGAYLGRLLRQLEDGDLDEALRRAIPLGAGGGEGRLSLGLPGRRSSLEINAGRGAGPSVRVEDQLVHLLAVRYRQAFQRLERLGRHDEAAFVLAELLRAEEEAVGYLERHGRLRQAAELAEGRGLRPGLVIRQWFLAGDRERAVRVARATRQWADAVSRLERSSHHAEAGLLRLAWAEELAEAGDLDGAVRAARPVASAAALVERWIELAVAAGGPAGHALLGTWAELRPDRFADVRERVLAACADAGPDGPARRREVAQGLHRARSTAQVRALARPVLRALLVDEGRQEPVPELKALQALAEDRVLEADRPPAAPAHGGALFSLVVRAGDRGAEPVHDAAALPGGRVLVALGEGGARLLTRDGRAVARFDAPAHRLVVSDLGTRALALGGRGEVVTVTRLDLEARTARRLRDVQLGGWAQSFDGVAWPVQHGDAVLLLDTLRDDLRTLWHVDRLEGHPAALERPRPDELTFVVYRPEGAEGWWYQGGTLRQRGPLAPSGPGEVEGFGAFVFDPAAALLGRWHGLLRLAEKEAPWLVRAGGGAAERVQLDGAEAVLALAGGARPVVALRCAGGVEVRWFTPTLAALGRLRLEGGAGASLRVAGDVATVADDQGRVVAIDLARGRLLADLRA